MGELHGPDDGPDASFAVGHRSGAPASAEPTRGARGEHAQRVGLTAQGLAVVGFRAM